jgi:hypothetical protein
VNSLRKSVKCFGPNDLIDFKAFPDGTKPSSDFFMRSKVKARFIAMNDLRACVPGLADYSACT